MELFEQDSGLRMGDVTELLLQGETFDSAQKTTKAEPIMPRTAEQPELFNEKGCLTNGGLTALIQGRLDTLGRLEVSEHLSYCDSCLDRYTALLTPRVIRQPERPIQAPVLRTVWAKTMYSSLGRGAVAAVAAILAMTFWATGTFHTGEWTRTKPPTQNQASVAVEQFWAGWGDFFAENMPNHLKYSALGAAHGGNRNG